MPGLLKRWNPTPFFLDRQRGPLLLVGPLDAGLIGGDHVIDVELAKIPPELGLL